MSGTVHPIRSAPRAAGWGRLPVGRTSTGRAAGRPARRYYRLTGEGAQQARAALARGPTSEPGRLAPRPEPGSAMTGPGASHDVITTARVLPGAATVTLPSGPVRERYRREHLGSLSALPSVTRCTTPSARSSPRGRYDGPCRRRRT